MNMQPLTKRDIKKEILDALDTNGEVFRVVSTREGIRLHMNDCRVWRIDLSITRLKDDLYDPREGG